MGVENRPKRGVFGGPPETPQNGPKSGVFGGVQKRAGAAARRAPRKPVFLGPEKIIRYLLTGGGNFLSRLGELLNTLENVPPRGPARGAEIGGPGDPPKRANFGPFLGSREPRFWALPAAIPEVGRALRARHPVLSYDASLRATRRCVDTCHVAYVALQATLGTQRQQVVDDKLQVVSCKLQVAS